MVHAGALDTATKGARLKYVAYGVEQTLFITADNYPVPGTSKTPSASGDG